VGAAFLFSLGNLLRVDPGFDPRNAAVLNITSDAADKSDDPVFWNSSHADFSGILLTPTRKRCWANECFVYSSRWRVSRAFRTPPSRYLRTRSPAESQLLQLFYNEP
jgi:hypothetical protein